MVKQLKITLDDNEYQRLVQAKGNLTWKDFVFQLLEFKQKMEQEGEFVPRDSLKEPYVDLARTLRKLGSLLKVVWKEGGYEHKKSWELEAAALLPLYISEVNLSDDEEKNLLLVMIMAIEELLNKRYPELSEELKWLIQGLRMLAKGYTDLYELSMNNFTQERSRRQGTSAD